MTVEKYLNNVPQIDIDVKNKLWNLHDSGQIKYDPQIIDDENGTLVSLIENYVMEHAIEYIDFIREETEIICESDCCEKDDWACGMWNCDELYIKAIENALTTW